jgi:glycogen debranching enzyme
MAALTGPDFYATPVGEAKRTLGDVLHSIARHYVKGTPNGIHVDPSSGLVWSPRHFTWMDTNYPAATPREGYPVEIQVLWIRLLRQLNRHSIRPRTVASQEVVPDFKALAHLAETSFLRLFWLESEGYLSDVLLAGAGTPAANATADNALRCNFLLAISLGILTGRQAQQSVGAAIRHLIIPGAVRSLAPLPVSPPLPVNAPDGRLLNKPDFPYAPHYEGDEDTQRKPAYHNGTAWTWMWPVFCEALVRAWNGSPFSVNAAKAYLGSVDRLLQAGCLGHLPEILDGDAPHRARGCDAQAWGMTEVFRVWRWLETAELKRH